MARMRAPERRRQLLEVAAKLFAKRGYRGTTTAELAYEAGVTEPVLYRHFESKLDMFVALVHEVGRLVIHAWREALDDVDDPHERLRTLLSANPAVHTKGKGMYRVIFHAMAALDDEPEIAAAIRRHVTRLHAFVAGELEHLQAEDVIRNDESPEVLAWLLVHAAIGYGMVAPLGGAKIAAMASGGSMQRLLAELLGAES